MATVHSGAVLVPTKLEMLGDWLPTRPWFRAGPDVPAKAGGFRLDDPAGAVGIEFMVVAAGAAHHLVPLTYRDAPCEEAAAGLIGTMRHEVLGQRWVYDACHDPVAVAETLALLHGRVRAQAQSVSDTADDTVIGRYDGPELNAGDLAGPVDDPNATTWTSRDGMTVRLRRVPDAETDDAGTLGEISGDIRPATGPALRRRFLTVHAP